MSDVDSSNSEVDSSNCEVVKMYRCRICPNLEVFTAAEKEQHKNWHTGQSPANQLPPRNSEDDSLTMFRATTASPDHAMKENGLSASMPNTSSPINLDVDSSDSDDATNYVMMHRCRKCGEEFTAAETEQHRNWHTEQSRAKQNCNQLPPRNSVASCTMFRETTAAPDQAMKENGLSASMPNISSPINLDLPLSFPGGQTGRISLSISVSLENGPPMINLGSRIATNTVAASSGVAQTPGPPLQKNPKIGKRPPRNIDPKTGKSRSTSKRGKTSRGRPK